MGKLHLDFCRPLCYFKISMLKTSLQTRLTILTALASVFLISAFTAIQVNNQLLRAREYNTFKAKEGAFVIRRELQNIFSIQQSAAPQLNILGQIKKTFLSLKEADMIDAAALIDTQGNPVLLEGNLKLYFEDGKEFISKLSAEKDESKWLVTTIDKDHKIGNLFVNVKNPFGYIAKISFSLGNLDEVLKEVYQPVILIIIVVLIGNALLAGLLSRAIIFPIKVFNRATKDIAAGDLDLKLSVNTEDELEELAGTFNYMTVELKKMKARAENANPLTKLPGNIVIREEVEKRLAEGKKIMLIYSDLDNFKAFNDKYGVEAGDRAILLTAEIIKESISKKGRPEEDFLGHEGGDDFLMLTTPERANILTDYIIDNFDQRIRSIYSQEDLESGFIVSLSREGIKKEFPIMTISLAGVSNQKRTISSYAQMTNIAAELKHKVKELSGSNFLIDRRTDDKGIRARDN